jgi:hypothetical protein
MPGNCVSDANNRRVANLVGAWSLAAAQAVQDATDGELGGSGSLAAALVTVSLFPRLLEPLARRERDELVRLLEKLLPALPDDRDEARRICRLCDHPACERSWCPVSAGAPGELYRSGGSG